MDSHRPVLHHFGAALLEFKSHELQLSELKSLEVHSSKFNSLKIRLHDDITPNDRIGFPGSMVSIHIVTEEVAGKWQIVGYRE